MTALPGQRVQKRRSGKPFKSGFKINTVKGISVNPHTDKPAYTFEEDDSIVDQQKCEVVKENQ